MINQKITSIILCGGSGTDLWPLSCKRFPKQFVPLVDHKSPPRLTLERVVQVNGDGKTPHVMLVAMEGHQFLVGETMQAVKVKGHNILEPAGRNTAPAMALAALRRRRKTCCCFVSPITKCSIWRRLPPWRKQAAKWCVREVNFQPFLVHSCHSDIRTNLKPAVFLASNRNTISGVGRPRVLLSCHGLLSQHD